MSIRIVLFLVAFVFLTGCAEKPAPVSESKHEQHLSYVDMVSQIKSQANSIESAFTAGKPDDAHHSLHEIGNLLLEVSHVAEISSFGETDLADVHSAAKSLLEAFGKLDAVMHKASDDHSDDTTYEDVASDVSAGLEILESKLELPGANVAHEDDHSGHDDGGGDHGDGHDSHAGHDEDDHGSHAESDGH